jgi:hypothetical protein
MVTKLRLSRQQGQGVPACRERLLRLPHGPERGETAQVGSSRDSCLDLCHTDQLFLPSVVSLLHGERSQQLSLLPHSLDVSERVLASLCFPPRLSCCAILECTVKRFCSGGLRRYTSTAVSAKDAHLLIWRRRLEQSLKRRKPSAVAQLPVHPQYVGAGTLLFRGGLAATCPTRYGSGLKSRPLFGR